MLLSTSPHAGSEDFHRDPHTILVLNSWSLSVGSLCVLCTDFFLPNQTICWISQSCRLFLSTPPHPSFIEIMDIHCCIDFKCMAGWLDFLFLFNQAILSTTGGRYLSPSQGPRTPEHNRSLWQLPRLQSPQEAVGWGWGGQASGLASQERTDPHVHRTNRTRPRRKDQRRSSDSRTEIDWLRGDGGQGRRRRPLGTRVSHRIRMRKGSPGLSKSVVRTPQENTHLSESGHPPSEGVVPGVMVSAQRGVGRAWPAPWPSAGGHPLRQRPPVVSQLWPPPFPPTHYPTFLNKMFSDGMFQENSIETWMLSRVKQITSPGWMHESSARAWCTGKTQRDQVKREVGGGIRMGNTCKSMANSCQCMTKTTIIL